MGTKEQPGEFDCYGAALPSEPLFTLLGRDKLAPGLVRAWADEREDAVARGEAPETDREKIVEARACAARMEAWRAANNGAWRLANPELPFTATPARTPCQTGEPCLGGDCRCA